MIGVAVSCYIGHLDLLLELFDSIENQTRLPDRVVVSCSSTKPEEELKNMNQYSFEYEIIYTPEYKNASANRNIAISKLLDMEYVSFIDADDVMHPQNIELILRTFEETEGDIILHKFSVTNNLDTIHKLEYTVNELFVSRCGCITSNYGYHIHHSQSTVRRYTLEFVKYDEDPQYNRKEDCVFCRQVFQLRNVVNVYIMNELSWYRPSGTIF
jgi:glycosyltransferase involved in cell wall biosynthesis